MAAAAPPPPPPPNYNPYHLHVNDENIRKIKKHKKLVEKHNKLNEHIANREEHLFMQDDFNNGYANENINTSNGIDEDQIQELFNQQNREEQRQIELLKDQLENVQNELSNHFLHNIFWDTAYDPNNIPPRLRRFDDPPPPGGHI